MATKTAIMLKPSELKEAAKVVGAVENIDRIIVWLAKDLETQSFCWGQKIRHAFGQNRLDRLSNEIVGKTTFCALVNTLLLERKEITDGYGDWVEFPPPPCPEQSLQNVMQNETHE